MSAQRRLRNHQKASRLPRVNSVGKFGFLQHATINLYLRQPAHHRFQTSVPSAQYIIRVEPHHLLRPSSVPPSLLGKPLCRFAHPLPLNIIFLPLSDLSLSSPAGRFTLQLGPVITLLSGFRACPLPHFDMPSIPQAQPDQTLTDQKLT